jgi:hypothetical protein
MGTGGYKITDQGAMCFVSFAEVGWVDVFTKYLSFLFYKPLIYEEKKYRNCSFTLVTYLSCSAL